MVWRASVLATALLFAWGCTGGSPVDDTDDCTTGSVGCDCNADGSCDEGFTCFEGTCAVEAPVIVDTENENGTDSDPVADPTCADDPCDANATCDDSGATLTCSCNDGWTGDGFLCSDIDECALGTDDCTTGYQCANNLGSFSCLDVDECALGTDDCATGYDCANTLGSWSCLDIDECALGTHDCTAGYNCANTLGAWNCVDIDECALGTDNCTAGFDCLNTPGTFSCNDIDECALGTDNCISGFECINIPGNWTCNDIDECALGTHDCTPGYDCQNISGTWACNEIDECALGTDDCATGFDCANTPGAWVCNDIDECALGTDNCHTAATCSNSDGNFTCACNAGFTGDGLTCNDIDECALGTDDCTTGYDCTNTTGSWVCNDVDECALGIDDCTTGYDCANTAGAWVCNDVDECALGIDDCTTGYDCANTAGAWVCNDVDECALGIDDCTTGYDCANTAGAWVCNDIDECALGTHDCTVDYTCENTVGGWNCIFNSIEVCSACDPADDRCASGLTCAETSVGVYECIVDPATGTCPAVEPDPCANSCDGFEGLTCGFIEGWTYSYTCACDGDIAGDATPGWIPTGALQPEVCGSAFDPVICTDGLLKIDNKCYPADTSGFTCPATEVTAGDVCTGSEGLECSWTNDYFCTCDGSGQDATWTQVVAKCDACSFGGPICDTGLACEYVQNGNFCYDEDKTALACPATQPADQDDCTGFEGLKECGLAEGWTRYFHCDCIGNATGDGPGWVDKGDVYANRCDAVAWPGKCGAGLQSKYLGTGSFCVVEDLTTLTCPATEPAALDDCTGLEGLECGNVENWTAKYRCDCTGNAAGDGPGWTLVNNLARTCEAQDFTPPRTFCAEGWQNVLGLCYPSDTSTLTCPATEPTAQDDCTGLEGLECGLAEGWAAKYFCDCIGNATGDGPGWVDQGAVVSTCGFCSFSGPFCEDGSSCSRVNDNYNCYMDQDLTCVDCPAAEVTDGSDCTGFETLSCGRGLGWAAEYSCACEIDSGTGDPTGNTFWHKGKDILGTCGDCSGGDLCELGSVCRNDMFCVPPVTGTCPATAPTDGDDCTGLEGLFCDAVAQGWSSGFVCECAYGSGGGTAGWKEIPDQPICGNCGFDGSTGLTTHCIDEGVTTECSCPGFGCQKTCRPITADACPGTEPTPGTECPLTAIDANGCDYSGSGGGFVTCACDVASSTGASWI